MRIVPFALTTLALSVRAQQAPKSSHEAEAAGGPAQPKQDQDALARPPAGHARHHAMAERALVGYSTLGTRWNKCLDVTAGNRNPGTHLQIWECTGNANQQWKFSGGLLRTTGGMCADIPYGVTYPGVAIQIWTCDTSNKNQMFELVGTNVRFKNSNYCIDVKDGKYDPGRSVQGWPCSYSSDPNSGNQHWWVGGQPKGSAAPAAPPQAQTASGGTWLGHPVISIDAFVQKHPECAPFKQAFIAAGADQGLHPTFLASIAEQESTCQEYPPGPNGAFGIMQFMNPEAARQYVHTDQGKSITNAWDAIYGAARYFRDLLNQNGNDLHAALRSYNGDVADGGLASYQADIYA